MITLKSPVIDGYLIALKELEEKKIISKLNNLHNHILLDLPKIKMI